MFKQPFSSLGPPVVKRATTRLGNAKVLQVAAVSAPGLLAGLEAASFTGLRMADKSHAAARAHVRRDHEQRSRGLLARPAPPLSGPFPLRLALLLHFFVVNPLVFFPPLRCVWLATSISYRRQKLLHRFGT